MINFNEFEEIFRLGGGPGRVDDGTPKMPKKSRKIEQISLLEANRLRNCGRCHIFIAKHLTMKLNNNLTHLLTIMQYNI